MLKFTQFCNLELQEKSAFPKIIFESGEFLKFPNIFGFFKLFCYKRFSSRKKSVLLVSVMSEGHLGKYS